MKSLLTIAALIMLLGAGCNQKQAPFGVKTESNEPLSPDPRAAKMWGQDLTVARARAQESGKLVLLDFTGSDWCPPCVALHDFVFTQPEFLDFAEKNLELVELDFPKNKTIDQKLAAANARLAEKYNVEGFPTVIVMDGGGKVIHRDVGYSQKNAKSYTANLAKVLGR